MRFGRSNLWTDEESLIGQDLVLVVYVLWRWIGRCINGLSAVLRETEVK